MALRSLLLVPLLLTSLAGCASNGIGSTVALGQPVVMAPGQRVALPDGAGLLYVEVTDDSRCRPDVQCIRAGDANVVFEFFAAESPPAAVTLNTDKAPAMPIGPWQLRLLSLGFGDAPTVTVRIDPVPR